MRLSAAFSVLSILLSAQLAVTYDTGQGHNQPQPAEVNRVILDGVPFINKVGNKYFQLIFLLNRLIRA
jgi:hypothetical protein